MKQIKEGIFEVGALNPALRVFDIVMTTDYGTSYNSYLVKGSAKTALIDVCHKSFFDVYRENIREVCDPKSIDCIVLNHNEPDHTGALAQLLRHICHFHFVIGIFYLLPLLYFEQRRLRNIHMPVFNQRAHKAEEKG